MEFYIQPALSSMNSKSCGTQIHKHHGLEPLQVFLNLRQLILLLMINIENDLKKIQEEQISIFNPSSKLRRLLSKNNETFKRDQSQKPYSTSAVHDIKSNLNRQDILKLTTKIQLIKSKCMKNTAKTNHNLSAKGIDGIDQFVNQNESVDLESEEDTHHTNLRNGKVKLLRSIFPNRPSTIFFQYSKSCGIQQNSTQIERGRVYESQKMELTYKVSGWQYKCIINTLEYNGFQKAEDGNWNVFFDINGSHTKNTQNLNRHQKISHFPGCWNLGLKDFMWRHLHRQKRSHPEDYNFVPTTYLFPGDYDRFQIVRQGSQKSKLWIMKPTNQACGRGIKMVTKQTKLKNKKDVLVSQYIANPHLINGFKYDLRIYVVVTSYDPLRVYMFKEGLTRFATYQYTNRVKDIKKRFIHLTNFSVNKHSKTFVKNAKSEQDGQGSKWSLTALKKHYDSIGINSDKLFESIKDVVLKTCISAEPVMLDMHSKTQQKRTCCFELYGFDILIDQNLKPWLMEVNVCPSLSSSSPMDKKIKNTLIADMLNLVGVYGYSRKNFQIGKKKQKERLLQQQSKKYYSKNINSLQELTFENCVDILTPEDWLILFQTEQELSRMGNFQRVFPNKNNVDKYKSLFQINRYNNQMLWQSMRSSKNYLTKLYH